MISLSSPSLFLAAALTLCYSAAAQNAAAMPSVAVDDAGNLQYVRPSRATPLQKLLFRKLFPKIGF